ncbi:MAG: RNA 2',3'-cyclic phosphodiesterase [Candidatus Competibacterales bacterium]|nr:RNA 2',3'-cyclic phosphodiesterase [Candidatus Competibacterales bacterium]
MSSRPAENRRLFLALWPDDTVRRQLAAVARQAAGERAVPRANLHLTLLFLGTTPPRTLSCYLAALADLAPAPPELTLDRLGWWPGPGILWLGPVQTPPPLQALVDELGRRLGDCGFTPERRPFRAHVTLARRWRKPPPESTLPVPVVWSPHGVSLIESLPHPSGVNYRPLHHWPDSHRDPEALE